MISVKKFWYLFVILVERTISLITKTRVQKISYSKTFHLDMNDGYYDGKCLGGSCVFDGYSLLMNLYRISNMHQIFRVFQVFFLRKVWHLVIITLEMAGKNSKT